MFRFLVCATLVFGITAKPYKPWNELPDEVARDTVLSIDGKGKLSWKVEVEPPEDMGETFYEIDPSMRIWKSVTGLDKDELDHPSTADLLKAQIQNLQALSAGDIQTKPLQEQIKSYQVQEEDRDHIDHPVVSKAALEGLEQDWEKGYLKASDELDRYLAPLKNEYKVRSQRHSEPEKDEDDLYHRDNQLHLQPAPLVQVKPQRSEVRVHHQPEEDMDDLYHKDTAQLIPHQVNSRADSPVYLPLQRKHSEPEEDLDGLYHQ